MVLSTADQWTRTDSFFFSSLVIKLATLYFARSGELIILVRQRSVNRPELNEIKFPEIAAQGFLNSSALLAVRCGKMRKAEKREKRPEGGNVLQKIQFSFCRCTRGRIHGSSFFLCFLFFLFFLPNNSLIIRSLIRYFV